MEESNGTEICTNCKREIPAANFMTHSVHCSRNIKICTVCKEPVPQNELQDHHDRLHKLVPCKKCQEMVRGTDMEDHIRDSCDFTMQTCRFCALELRRREMPAHERYCGSRTERCADCGEYVMLRYRQLHLDSNHSFICLDEDTPAAPAPSAIKTPTWQPFTNYVNMQTGGSKTPPKPSTDLSSFRNRRPPITEEQIRERILANFPLFNPQGPSNRPDEPAGPADRISRPEPTLPQPAEPKKTPEKPEKSKNESVRLNGVRQKKRAPPPPEPAPKAERDRPYCSALQRRRHEEERRRLLNERNLANGLPPVLDPLSKLEKLRKMDALQNREVPDDKDYKNILQGRVWYNSNVSPGQRLGGSSRADGRDNGESTTIAQSADSHTSLKDIQPMSVDEFAARLRQLQLRNDPQPTVETDRFGEIRSSLRDLRRGLNEVTAPYNNNNSMGNNNLAMDLNYTSTTTDVNDFGQLDEARARSPTERSAETEVVVPCEFCARALPASRLARHQSACIASLEQPVREARLGGVGRSASTASEDDVPVIPCEFCTEALPYYLITEHQERCGREANLLYPD